jgi:hypothetical protein
MAVPQRHGCLHSYSGSAAAPSQSTVPACRLPAFVGSKCLCCEECLLLAEAVMHRCKHAVCML